MSTPPEQPLVPPSGPTTPTEPVPTAPTGAPTPPVVPPDWRPPESSTAPYPGSFAPPTYPGGWSGAAPAGDPGEALRKAGTALGWAIGAAVGAGLALVLVLVLIVVQVGSAPYEEGDYYSETLRGQVVGLAGGSNLGGDRLEYVIGGLLDEYEIEHELECPDAEAVTVSTVVVCRGEVDGYEWTGVVVFEDEAGSFAVVEL